LSFNESQWRSAKFQLSIPMGFQISKLEKYFDTSTQF